MVKLSLVILLFALASFCQCFAQGRPDFLISENGSNPFVHVDQNNNLDVFWVENFGHLWYRLYDSLGNPTTEPKSIANQIAVERPRFATNASGGMLVGRDISDLPFMNSYIFGQRFGLDGDTVGGTVRLNETFFNAFCYNPDIATLTDSTFFVVWSATGPGVPGDARGIYGQIVTNNLQTIGGNLLLSDDIFQNEKNGYPRIASHEVRDTLAVIWFDSHLRGNSVRMRLFTKEDGMPLGDSFIVSTDINYQYVWSPTAAMLSDGTIVTSWSAELPDGSWNTYLQLFRINGTPLSPIQKINQANTYGADVRIAVDRNDKFVIIWQGNEEGQPKLIGQRFLATGAPYFSNFRVSTVHDSLGQYYHSVDIHNNSIYIAWHTVTFTDVKAWARIIEFEDSTITNITPLESSTPKAFTLHQNYPNPFNPSTTFTLEIHSPTTGQFFIYDINGRVIAELFAGALKPGVYQLSWDGKTNEGINIPSGTYFYQLRTKEQVQTKKSVLIR